MVRTRRQRRQRRHRDAKRAAGEARGTADETHTTLLLLALRGETTTRGFLAVSK
jgi:hypothetical protein